MILQILMELVVKAFMVQNLKMKILSVNIWKEDIYQWLMQEKIQMEANFL